MRKEFTDAQKAEIYKRDRALCAFSGKSLWIFDFGLSPTYSIDWVDHIKPDAKGGTNETSNGICASYFYNKKKRDNSNDNKYLFFSGLPTQHFYEFYETVPDNLVAHIKSFKNIEISDWYFNRACYRFLLGVNAIRSKQLNKGYSRDDVYYAKSCFKILKTWRKVSKDDEHFMTRLMSDQALSNDQVKLLSLQDCDSVDEVLELMHSCFGSYNTAKNLIDRLSTATEKNELIQLMDEVKSHNHLPERTKDMLMKNAANMQGCF